MFVAPALIVSLISLAGSVYAVLRKPRKITQTVTLPAPVAPAPAVAPAVVEAPKDYYDRSTRKWVRHNKAGVK